MNHITKNGMTTVLENQGKISLEAIVRNQIRNWTVEMIDEELESALNASPGKGTGKRCGYRNGTRRRSITSTV